MARNKSRKIEEDPKNFWGFALRLLDKIRPSVIVVLIGFLGSLWIIVHGAGSKGTVSIANHAVDRLVSLSPLVIVVLASVALNIYQLIGCRKKAAVLKQEIVRLDAYKKKWCHFKRQCFDFINENIKAGKLSKYEDLEKVHGTLSDLQHLSCGFELVDQDEGN